MSPPERLADRVRYADGEFLAFFLAQFCRPLRRRLNNRDVVRPAGVQQRLRQADLSRERKRLDRRRGVLAER